MGIAAGRLALAFRGLKALALRGERSSHCSSYLPIRAFLIIASNPMLVLEFSWTDWLLQLISPGRYGRGRREGTGGGREPHEKTDGGTGRGGERRQGRREETNSQHILAKQQTLSSCSSKRCDAPVLLLPAPSRRPRAWQGLMVGWDGTSSGIWVSGVLQAGRDPGDQGLGGWGGRGKGVVAEPRGATATKQGAVVPTQSGSAWGKRRVTWTWAPSEAHTGQREVCQELGSWGSFPWRKSQGRKSGHPTKSLDGKEVTRFGLGMRGGKGGQPLAKGTQPGEPAWGRAMLGRGESPDVPPGALCKPLPIPQPTPLLPAGRVPTAGPSRAEPRLRDRMQRRSGVSAWL